ncbi:MAG: ribonuclease E/G, partial [Rhodospirillaceae bacterium]
VSSRRQLKGNIYLAKVIRVEPSLQAAFVDYGGNRHGFLAFSEIHPDYYQIPVADREEAAEAEKAQTASEDAAAEAQTDEAAENSENSEASEDDENAEAAEDKAVEVIGGDDSDDIEETQTKSRPPSARRYKIQEVIKRRQVLLVQVVKEERGNKGAALTTYMSLAGRYCVLMPNTARGGGISRKITNSADRKALKAILTSLDVPEGMAVILRTAGIGRTKAEVKRDFEYLIRLWNNVRDLTLKSTAPNLVHEEGDIVRRSIRDLYSRDIEEVLVQGDDAYKAAKDFMKLLIPSHARRVKHYKDAETPLLRQFGVESQMDAMHNPIVHLPSGGYLVINPTEALVSVDVNSGKSTKERNIEETALKTNLEAADALARQLKLRDLAGLVVIDFIDMDIHRNNSSVERRMKEALKHDRARIQVGRISPFGLLEMSRQRLRPSLIETSSEPCPYCAGTGIRRSTDSTALVVLRAIDEEGAGNSCTELTVHVPTAVALYILNNKRDAVVDLERKHGFKIVFANDDSLIPPDLRLERTKNQDGDTISEMVATQRTDVVEDTSRKRRRRRGGRNRNNNTQNPNQNQAEATDTTESPAPAPTPTPQEGEASADGDEEERPKRRRRSRRGGRGRNRNANVNAVEGSETTEATETAVPQGETAEGAVATPVEGAENTPPADGEDRPKRRRPRRRRRSPAAQTENADGTETTATKADEASIESNESTESAESNDNVDAQADTAAEKPKPRRPRTRRRKPAEAKTQTEGDNADSATPKTAEKVADEKPKRTRTRAKKVVEPKAEPKVEAKAEPKVEAVKEVAVAPAPAPAPTPTPTPEPKPEPAPTPKPVEGVTVNGEATKKPKRKGWWNLGS